MPALLKREATGDLGGQTQNATKDLEVDTSVIKFCHKRLMWSSRAATRSPGCWKSRHVAVGSLRQVARWLW